MKPLEYFFAWWVLRVLVFNIALAGGGGLALIAYELSADWLGLRETKLADIARIGGPLLTLVGVAVTAASIYLPVRVTTKPSPESYFTAPVAIVACVIAACVLIYRKRWFQAA